MRRFIGYLLLCATAFIGVGVSFVPTATTINCDLSYRNGKEMVFQLTNRDGSDYDILDDENAAKDMAAIMESRLDTNKTTDYSVEVRGNDTIAVTATAKSETEYESLSKFLSFNGKFSIATTDDEVNFIGDEMFKDVTAYIEYDGTVPVLVMPISDPTKFATLVEHAKEIEGGSEEDHASEAYRVDGKHNHDDDGEETVTNSIVLWANRIEGEDLYEKRSESTKIADKILLEFTSSSIYYDDSTDKIQYRYTPETDDNGTTTVKAVSAANDKAIAMMNLYNAGEINYECEMIYSNSVDATVEPLLSYSETISLTASRTLIGTLIAVAVICILLGIFYRLTAVGMVATILTNTFLTFLIYTLFGSLFNISAVVGLIITALSSTFLCILFESRFKEEVYKGRAFKKACSEASKKITFISIDIGIVSSLVGLFVYLIGGTAVQPLGVILIVGGILGMIVNNLILKLTMWLVINEQSFQGKYRLFNIEAKYVPDLMKDEKPNYQGPYAKETFAKNKKPSAIILSAIAVACLVGVLIFGSLNSSIYNSGNLYTPYSDIYLVTDTKESTIDSIKYVKEGILANIKVNGEPIKYTNVDYETRDVTDEETGITTTYHYYVVSMNETYKSDDINSTYTYNGKTSQVLPLSDCLEAFVYELDETADVSLKTCQVHSSTPNTVNIVLAALAGFAVATVYLAFRFRLGRALTLFAFEALSALVAIGTISLFRVVSSPIVSIMAVLTGMIIIMIGLYILSKEKEILREHKVKTLELRKEALIKATPLALMPIISFTFVAIFFMIDYAFFGSSIYCGLFIGTGLATLCAIIGFIYLYEPIATYLAKGLSHIKLPKIERKHKKSKHVNKTGEPQEAIFIGIND